MARGSDSLLKVTMNVNHLRKQSAVLTKNKEEFSWEKTLNISCPMLTFVFDRNLV